ncbi:MAG: hypothetical protein HYS04_19825 [Acidobacteria bacterium]|nr:hypothetical protein [Acidobacteriota bacterium]
MRGDICSLCCGTEREVNVDCPLDCPYLQEARQHEKPPVLNPDDFPNRDIRITDRFLEDNEPLLTFLARRLAEAALEVPGLIDFDVRESLQSLIKTYRTMQTGLIYESLPSNPLAAHVFRRVQAAAGEIREEVARGSGVHSIRDADVLGVLVFLERLELQHNNGRRKGRAFIDFLRQFFPQRSAEHLVRT